MNYSSNMNKKEMSQHSNHELAKRNIPSHPIEPYLSFHPVQTKYQILPIFNIRNDSGTQFQKPYETILTPPSRSYHVNTESELRNQLYSLSKNNTKHTYIPNSNSDLYFYRFESNNNILNPHQHLNKKENFQTFNPNPNNLGNSLFHNNTRVQLKQLNK